MVGKPSVLVVLTSLPFLNSVLELPCGMTGITNAEEGKHQESRTIGLIDNNTAFG